MATFNKFNQFVEDLAKKVHNLNSDTLKVLLTPTLPVAANAVYADVSGAELSTANGYTVGGQTTAFVSGAQTSGVYKLILTDLVWTASGGSIGPFRYAVLYNSTPSSPLKPLIGWHDYGSSITVLNSETFTWDTDGSGGILTIT